MVGGLDKFREAFSRFSDNFVIIGGAACDEVLSSTDITPRATLDIDIVVIVENMTAEFASAFWRFITEGGYRPGIRKNADSSIKYVLYSFDHGRPGYPVKIELLSHHNDIFSSATHIEPMPVDGEVSSLSAIILDEPYYKLTVGNSFISHGLRYATPIALIALKARAYLNLLAEREAGRKVNTKDILKHRNDVLKLTATMSMNDHAEVDVNIVETIAMFVSNIRAALPSQSLTDALRGSNDTLTLYLDALPSFYTIRQ